MSEKLYTDRQMILAAQLSYGEGKFMIETVEFADVSKYELSEIANLANLLDGTE